MMDLFGGFPNEVYQYYIEQWPLAVGWGKRQDLFKLYYMLVHLNIFGKSYERACISLIRKLIN